MENMNKSRTFNAKRNVLSGVVKQVVGMVLTFLLRTVLLYVLGAEYQGLNGLFTSILQVLNLTDLGFSTAVVYVLYKPIAENDNDAICAIIRFLRRTYTVVGLVILALGLCIMPFLPRLVTGSIPYDINIYALFLVYLVNTSLSYLMFAYKSALLTAMQREDVVSKVYTISSFVLKLIQIILLLLFRNYYVYIFVMPVGTIINNVLLQISSKKLFPRIVPKGSILSETKGVFVKQIKAIFIGRVADVARNAFDNIVISSILGLVTVAIYDNYYYIFTALFGGLSIIIHGVKAGVGNNLVLESIKKNYDDLQKFDFIYMTVVGWCAICMFCLYQPFMYLWMRGKSSMLLNDFDMMLFCIYFYSINMTCVRGMYLSGYGLFHECRFWYIIEAISNLGLNIILGKLLGVTGILLATIITIVVFNYIPGTNIVFKHYFKKSPIFFYLHNMVYIAVTVGNAMICRWTCSFVPLSGVLGLLIKASICGLLSSGIYFAVYHKNKLFIQSLSFMRNALKNRR